jgi:hypothetical protein
MKLYNLLWVYTSSKVVEADGWFVWAESRRQAIDKFRAHPDSQFVFECETWSVSLASKVKPELIDVPTHDELWGVRGKAWRVVKEGKTCGMYGC